MRLPRFRIAWVMLFVAVAAINFAGVRAALGSRGPTHGLLAIGALPVASVLAMGLLAGRRRPDRHAFLLGFTTFGAVALALYLFLAIFLAEQTLVPSGAQALSLKARKWPTRAPTKPSRIISRDVAIWIK